MSLLSFKIEKIKAVALAECSSVPKVMVIAGPNGIGKSTILYEISQKRGTILTDNTDMLYQGPHRVLRKTNVRRSWLGGAFLSMLDLLGKPAVDGYEGLNLSGTSRTPDNVDEAGSTLKHTLGKIENKRQNILAQYVDSIRKTDGSIDTSKLPDIFHPIKELTKYLLPHLKFDRIDFTNEDNIRCVWIRNDGVQSTELDIDDLSSGEKSIIILFLPLLEKEINKSLATIEQLSKGQELIAVAEVLRDRVFVIDEPEQHLHPELQARILTYIRNLTTDNRTQFIISTHSPTLLDQALDNELFLLSPKTANPDENQLKKVASNIERLEALKELAGNAYLITTGRTIICVEGVSNTLNTPTDIHLLEILYPRSTAFTFVPVGGKGNVITTVRQLRNHLTAESFNIKVSGLVDRDQIVPANEGIFALPVCMIENLLLDGEAIFEYLQAIGVEGASDLKSIKDDILAISNSLREQEISIRIMKKLKAHTVRLTGITLEQIKEKLTSEMVEVEKMIPSDETLLAIIKDASDEVDGMIKSGFSPTCFRGKDIIRQIYSKYIPQEKNISYTKFCYEIAEIIAQKESITALLNPLFDQIVNGQNVA